MEVDESMNDKDFVTYNQAVKLYELGFDEDVSISYYIHTWMNQPRERQKKRKSE